MVPYMYWRICFASFQCILCGSCMNLETVPTSYERFGLECVRYNKLPTSCRYNVLSTNGVSPPSSILTPDRKGFGADLQSVMWNISRRSRAYLAWDSLIPDASWLISSPRKKLVADPCPSSKTYHVESSWLQQSLKSSTRWSTIIDIHN